MELDARESRRRFAWADVARLATVDETGQPHLVAVVFVLEGDLIWTAVDQKPKRTLELKRLRNIAYQPRVSMLVDHYEPDWEKLWWVRVDGEARIVRGEQERTLPIRTLQRKYPQYRTQPPHGPIIEISIRAWSSWSAQA